MKCHRVALCLLKVLGGFPFSRNPENGQLEACWGWAVWSFIRCFVVVAAAVLLVIMSPPTTFANQTTALTDRLWFFSYTLNFTFNSLFMLVFSPRLAMFLRALDNLQLECKQTERTNYYDILVYACGIALAVSFLIASLNYLQISFDSDHTYEILWYTISYFVVWFLGGMPMMLDMGVFLILTRKLQEVLEEIVSPRNPREKYNEEEKQPNKSGSTGGKLVTQVESWTKENEDFSYPSSEGIEDRRGVCKVILSCCRTPQDRQELHQRTNTKSLQLNNNNIHQLSARLLQEMGERLLKLEETVELLLLYFGAFLLVLTTSLAIGMTLSLYFVIDVYLDAEHLDWSMATTLVVMLILFLLLNTVPDHYNAQVGAFSSPGVSRFSYTVLAHLQLCSG